MVSGGNVEVGRATAMGEMPAGWEIGLAAFRQEFAQVDSRRAHLEFVRVDLGVAVDWDP